LQDGPPDADTNDGRDHACPATAAVLALAADLPRYDAPGHCQKVSGVSSGSSMINSSGIGMEQQAYDKLKRNWPSIPARRQSYCEEVGCVAGQSNSILESCIGMKMDAAGNSSTFTW